MIYSVLNLVIFACLIVFLFKAQQSESRLSRNVFIGLILGIIFGLVLHYVYSNNHKIIITTLKYVNIVAEGYLSLLQMIIMPLILTSIITAIIKIKDTKSLGKISLLSIGILLSTTAASALIGILVSNLFNLSMEGFLHASDTIQSQVLTNKLNTVKSLAFSDMIISFFPTNPFADLAGSRPTSTIAVVIISVFIGISGLLVLKTQPELGKSFEYFMHVSQEIVRALVRMVLNLTPYGIMALVVKVVANSNYSDMLEFINFILASYMGLGLILILHLMLISMIGINPIDYLKKILPVLIFAFTSRSSSATIPLNIETQIKELGNDEGIANFSASFGATLGQNGCAGLYPAMLAMMVAPSVGINTLDPVFIITLISVITISSFGIAGIGGGGIFAALIVLSTLNMPVALVGLLAAIEPLIDMGRTAINVSGSITSGTITSRILKRKTKSAPYYIE